MATDSAPESNSQAAIDNRLKQTAFVVVASANCLYQPDPRAAVRIRPPYGTKVDVIQVVEDWVLIEFCSKQAWSPRQNLAASLELEREAVKVGIEPAPNFNFHPPSVLERTDHMNIEYGPRGGRFVRTSGGFRRYL